MKLLMLGKKTHKRIKRYKSKKNIEEIFNLLSGINYTYDYRIIWDQSAVNIFTELLFPTKAFEYGMPKFVSHKIKVGDNYEVVSYVDVKPHNSAARFGGNLSSFYTFPFVQKMLYHLEGIFVNKITPTPQGKHGVNSCLFAQTFTPNRYLFTDGGGSFRKLKHNSRSLNDYVSQKKKTIEEISINESKIENTNLDLFS